MFALTRFFALSAIINSREYNATASSSQSWVFYEIIIYLREQKTRERERKERSWKNMKFSLNSSKNARMWRSSDLIWKNGKILFSCEEQ